MVAIKRFEVERWMDDHEIDAKHNLAETCSASISLQDLVALGNKNTGDLFDLKRRQAYGAIRGSTQLRQNIANLYNKDGATELPSDQVLVFPGAISANFSTLFALVQKGDHVICQYPTYQQLYAVPEAHGAEVSLWKAEERNDWHMSIDTLRALLRPNTKLIILNNPQNPLGTVMSRQQLEVVIQIARERDMWVLGDEVYRPLYHGLEPSMRPPSVLSLGYEKTVSTCSMSKAFSLAGIRLGRVASRSPELLEACANVRDYSTISVSQIDDEVATLALSSPTVDNLLERNMALAQENLDKLEGFIKEHAGLCSWTRPRGGTTTFVKFTTADGRPVNDAAFCQQLQDQSGVMFVPGSLCFGGNEEFQGYVRIGYVPEADVMDEGLTALRRFMKSGYASVPAAK